MTKGLHRSISRVSVDRSIGIRQTIQVVDVELVVDGATGIGFGSAVIGGFPVGDIHIMSAQAYMQFTGPGSGNVSDVWEGDYSIGSTPATDGTLTTGDVHIVASSSLAAATNEVSPRTRGTFPGGGAFPRSLDNTDGSLEINLNLLVDDAHIDADDQVFTANGELTIVYMVMS